MRTYFRLIVLIPALFFVLPVLAQRRPAPAPAPLDPAKLRAKIYQDIAKSGKFVCKISGIPDEDAPEKIFEATVEHEVKKPSPEGEKRYQDAAKRYYQARRQRNVREAKKLYDEAMALLPGRWEVEKTPFSFKLIHSTASAGKKDDKEEQPKAVKTKGVTTASKELIIRREVLPPKDPENPKVKYTPQELKELKGPGNHPGYAATLKDLESDTVVIVYIDKSKFKPPVPPKKKKKGEEEAAPPEEKPIPITMIMIAKPPPGPKGNPLLGN